MRPGQGLALSDAHCDTLNLRRHRAEHTKVEEPKDRDYSRSGFLLLSLRSFIPFEWVVDFLGHPRARTSEDEPFPKPRYYCSRLIIL